MRTQPLQISFELQGLAKGLYGDEVKEGVLAVQGRASCVLLGGVDGYTLREGVLEAYHKDDKGNVIDTIIPLQNIVIAQFVRPEGRA